MNRFLFILLLAICTNIQNISADDHDHEEKHEEHEHAEIDPNVGEGKGVVEANENDGFKISPEATRNFDLKYIPVESSTVQVPKSAIFYGLQEKNIYRFRDGFYKRIDFKTLTKTGGTLSIQSPDLKLKDQIVTQGLGFLRVTEIGAFGGLESSHSH